MSLENQVLEMAKSARKAALDLAVASTKQKNEALTILAKLIRENSDAIIAENLKDLANASELSSAYKDRLTLTKSRIDAMADGVEQIVSLADPVGEIISEVKRPNGLDIKKVRTPIGVIAIVYESRPNVTIDCAALCLKSGNASILRGGKEALHSNVFLASLIAKALSGAGLNPDCVQILSTTDRAAINYLLKLDSYIDCIIPRGGESLIRFVVENSSIPVIKHYKGVCTVYADEFADADTAIKISVNSKCSRPGTCNASENLLVHKSRPELLLSIAKALSAQSVEIRALGDALKFLQENKVPVVEAFEQDFCTEYAALVISVKFADSLSDAIDFINAHGSGHSDAIVTKNLENAEIFLNKVDSACVYLNASTRFTDGFEFGLGAEIGISTDKLHARGPMGLTELCIYKYKIFGDGQIRI